MLTQPILQDKSIVVNTVGSWPVVDLEKSWNSKYLVYGAFFANERWNWTSVRRAKDLDKIGGFHLLDPVRWRIPCENGLVTASPGWPTLYFATRSYDLVEKFLRATRLKCSKPTRGEILIEEGENRSFLIRFWAEDYVPCFRLMRPLKETTKRDRLELPEFCASYPEKSLPDVGVPIRKTRRKRSG